MRKSKLQKKKPWFQTFKLKRSSVRFVNADQRVTIIPVDQRARHFCSHNSINTTGFSTNLYIFIFNEWMKKNSICERDNQNKTTVFDEICKTEKQTNKPRLRFQVTMGHHRSPTVHRVSFSQADPVLLFQFRQPIFVVPTNWNSSWSSESVCVRLFGVIDAKMFSQLDNCLFLK